MMADLGRLALQVMSSKKGKLSDSKSPARQVSLDDRQQQAGERQQDGEAESMLWGQARSPGRPVEVRSLLRRWNSPEAWSVVAGAALLPAK
jgi:hypothetical protein